MKWTFCVLTAVALHAAVGWVASAAAAMLAGAWLLRGRGVLSGATVLGAAWLALVLWNLIVAPQETASMFRFAASLVPGAPAWTIPILTVLIGAALGALAGGLGRSLGRLVRTGPESPAAPEGA